MALNLKKPDRPPWIEISFSPLVASAILKEEFKEEGSGFFPLENPQEYREQLKKWIRLAKKINLDALALKRWGPGFAGEKGPAYSGGTIKSIEDFRHAISNLPPLIDDTFYKCAKIFIEETKKEGIASSFQTHFGFENTVEGIGFEDFCYALFENQELIEAMLDFYVDVYTKIIHCFMEFKPDFLTIGDDLAFGQGPFITPEQWEKLFYPHFKKIAAEIKCPWVFHTDGNTLPIMESVLNLGMDGIHPIEPAAMNIKEIKEIYGEKVCLIGNLNMNIIARGTTADVEEGIKELFENVGKNGGWILSSSNSIDRGANLLNVIAMGKTIDTLCY